MSTGAGYTPAQIDELTLPQVQELFEYWRKHPPTHELVAWATAYKPLLTTQEQWAQGAMGPDDFAAWVKMTEGRAKGPKHG